MTEPMDISQRALSIARMIDRLEPGIYNIELVRPVSKTERWTVTVSQSVTVRRMSLEHKPLGSDLDKNRE